MKKPFLYGVLFLLIACPAYWGEASETPMKVSKTDFNLKSIDGKTTFKLSEQKGKYVALQFLLKTECPICLAHTRSYSQNANKHPEVVQVFIKPDTDEEIRAWADKLKLEKEETQVIYRDPDAQLAEAFGIPNGYQFHGQVVHYPAFILLNKEGKEVFRYVGKATQDRYDYKKFDELMKTMK